MNIWVAVRSEALAFSAFAFSNKASSGLVAWMTGMILALTGYVANQAQTETAADGIFAMVAVDHSVIFLQTRHAATGGGVNRRSTECQCMVSSNKLNG
ncbi:MAG: Na+/melibiose symporter-like transporter [Patiriisocius sp.]